MERIGRRVHMDSNNIKNLFAGERAHADVSSTLDKGQEFQGGIVTPGISEQAQARESSACAWVLLLRCCGLGRIVALKFYQLVIDAEQKERSCPLSHK